nr:dethiobiotin synthase [uncultured Holophaga sp.]
MKLADLPSPLWVLGTDTGVGKTHVSVCIARAWAETGRVVYRKPFQTGVESDRDPEADAPRLVAQGIQAETGLVLRAPLSPMAAAEREGLNLDLDRMRVWTARPVPRGTRLLLEPAGGVLVPLAAGTSFLDWAGPLGFPAVVVGRGGLGTLNHILLTCEVLLSRGWRIPLVILNPGVDGAFDAARENAALLRRILPMQVGILEDDHTLLTD